MLESFNHWLIFNVALVVLLVFDLLILTRGNREVGMKEAAWLTVFWTLVAGVVGVWVWTAGNSQQGIEYVTGYVAERRSASTTCSSSSSSSDTSIFRETSRQKAYCSELLVLYLREPFSSESAWR